MSTGFLKFMERAAYEVQVPPLAQNDVPPIRGR